MRKNIIRKVWMFITAGMIASLFLMLKMQPVYADELDMDTEMEMVTDTGIITEQEDADTDALDLDQVVDDEAELEPDGEPYSFSIYTTNLPDGECYVYGINGDASGALIIPATISVTYGETIKVYKVVGINDGAFNGKKGLTSVEFPEGIRIIKSGAFQDCTGLEGDLSLPDSVTKIENDAFARCTGLNGKLKLPSNLAEIGGRAFTGCGFTGSLDLPTGLEVIGYEAFKDCSGFTDTLIIPGSVNKILRNAFEGCTGFKNTLTIPASLSDVGKEVFKGCTGFTGLALSEGVTTVSEGEFTDCTGMTGTLVLPDSIKDVKNGAFKNCGFTGNLTIPDGITNLASEAFACPEIDGTLTVPQSVTNADSWAFLGMLKVKRIINNSNARLQLILDFIDRNDKETFFLNTATQEKLYGTNKSGGNDELPQGTFWRNGDFKVAVTGVSLDRTTAEMKVGGKVTLTSTVEPADATNKKVTWKSDKTSIATVNASGVVSGVSPGTTVITVTTNDGGKTAKCTVTVKPIAVTGVTLNKTSADLNAGSTLTLTATISPSNATNKKVTWKSSNTGIATVTDKGVVKGIKAGKATITVTTTDGKKTASCTITVKVPVKSVSIKNKITIIKGEKYTLKANITPDNATNKGVTWSSSDTKVAKVSGKGVVTAKKKGTAYITVTTNDGKKTATCKVTVKNPVKVKSVSLNKTKKTLKKGKTFKLKATITPKDATVKTVTWKSSNKKLQL